MTIYDYCKLTAPENSGYEWKDLKENILKVLDASWDPVFDDDKGRNQRNDNQR